MPWRTESSMDPTTVAFVHEFLRVMLEARICITYVMETTSILEQWVKKEWEPKHKGIDVSLTDRCIPGTLLTMAAALEQLNTIDDKLPSAHNISRLDWIVEDGKNQPCPCINEYEIPEATPVCDILEQIQNVFKRIVLMMKLIDVSVQPSFWEEVARAQVCDIGRAKKNCKVDIDIDHAKKQWTITFDKLESAITDIQSFVADNQTSRVADNAGTTNGKDLTPKARCTALLLRLSECTL